MYWLPVDELSSPFVKLPKEYLHYLKHVVRVRVGERLTLFDGKGKYREVEFFGFGRGGIKIVPIGDVIEQKKRELPSIRLAVGLPKKDKMDLIISQIVGLGVDEIYPLYMSRGVHLEKEVAQKRYRRWEKILIEGCRQSKRAHFPMINTPITLDQFLKRVPKEESQTTLKIVAWEESNKKIREVIKEVGKVTDVYLVVGPEGGINEEEIRKLKEYSFLDVMLSPYVLKVETAVVTLVAQIIGFLW